MKIPKADFTLNTLARAILVYFTENIALHKPTYQQYPYSLLGPGADASNAVDGLKSNLDYGGGQCAISANNKYTATLWVNLTSILSIHNIRIYYRTGNVEWGT